MPRGSRGRSGRRVRGERGLTLVEVVVVVFLLLLVLALAAPAVPRSRSGADRTAHALAQLLGRSRLAAVRGGIEVAVEVGVPRGEYRVLALGADGADSLLDAGTLPGDGTASVVGAGGEPRVVLRFGPLGRAEGGPVRVTDGQGRGRVVGVNPWTGRVRVATE
ncbi:MAG TPA: GspH/FimT family pseudopilin [Longimicrobiaceae bacterium]|nr:GspH/FimT family pseudopilin [Longimicrobiaceae bacterium]